jgi:hypothetical protein
MIITIEGEGKKLLSHHFQNKFDIAKLKRSLSQDRLAGEQRLRYLLKDLQCPVVMSVARINESYEEPGVGDASHFLENPLRVERSRGPFRMIPANRMNLRMP